MRIADILDYFRLRRHLADPRKFLRLRKAIPVGRSLEIALRDGGTIRLRPGTFDRHILHRALARDEYHLSRFRPGSLETVVDAGAHIGTFAIRATPLARRVICLEADPESFDLLVRNTVRHAHVAIIPRALAARPGRVRLLMAAEPSARSTVGLPGSPDPAGSIEVEAMTLAEVFAEQRIQRCSLLKLDVEGAEHEILSAMPPELWPRIDRIVLEVHPVPGRPDWTPGRLATILAAGGHRAQIRPRRGKPGSGHIFSERK